MDLTRLAELIPKTFAYRPDLAHTIALCNDGCSIRHTADLVPNDPGCERDQRSKITACLSQYR